MNKYEWEFESNDRGHYIAIVKAYDKQKKMRVCISASTITIDRWGSYWHGIKSYKKLEEVIKYYIEDTKRDIWRSMSFVDKLVYQAKKEYKEDGTTNILEEFIGTTQASINSNIRKLATVFDNND